jgi:hypothetical protein
MNFPWLKEGVTTVMDGTFGLIVIGTLPPQNDRPKSFPS